MKTLQKTPRGTGFALAGVVLAFSVSCMGGDLQVAVPKSTARVLAVGPIENRDSRYSPFTTRNFVDMLDFEFVRLGFDTLRPRDVKTRPDSEMDAKPSDKKPGEKSQDETTTEKKEPQSEDDRVPGEGAVEDGDEDASNNSESSNEIPDDLKNEPADSTGDDDGPGEAGEENSEQSESNDEKPILFLKRASGNAKPEQSSGKNSNPDYISELLPPQLRNVAGQNPPPEVQAKSAASRRKQFSKQEIIEFFADSPADFFLQGSIGRTESGDLLDSEQNTLIFLEIYGRTGERIGVVSFLINGETLETPDILREVCQDVANAISGQVLK